MRVFNQKTHRVFFALCLSIGVAVGCTNEYQPLAPATDPSSELVSFKTSTAPTIDGSIDALWEKATKLSNETEVPNPGNGLFAGYIGDKYKFSLRSMYDEEFIYFLAEWNDRTKGTTVQPWYFEPTSKRWAQEANSRQFDINGVLLREGIGQDQLAFLWNIDQSTPTFVSQTCYASCHIFNSYRNYAGVMVPNKSGNHYTNAINEKIDMWWLNLNKQLPLSQMDDQYQDWAGGPATTDTVGGNGNGRKADDLIPPTPYSSSYLNLNANLNNGPINNKVSLKLDGTGASVSVPAWIIPDATNIAYIEAADTLSGGKAKKITGVSSTGVLTYNGGSLDPNGVSDYQQIAGPYGGVGSKCIPSFITAPFSGGRADFTVKGTHTGTGWIVEFKRKLNTNSSLKQDVNFSSLQDQPFGIAIFNNSNNQHSIKPYLLLKFMK